MYQYYIHNRHESKDYQQKSYLKNTKENMLLSYF